MLKKSISFLLALIICISVITVIPVTSSAADNYAAPTNIKVTKLNNKGQIKVTWSAVKGAPYYAVFVKAGGAASWKRVKYTTKNAYIYSGAQNAVKYTFTVRVADQKGRYVSACNKAGVSLVYRPAWAKLYQDFVLNRRYLTYEMDALDWQNDSFFLYDIDFNGIPELFVNTGYIDASNVHEVFTCKNGRVVHLFRKPLYYTFSGYAPDSKYKGFFTFGGHTGYIAYTYHYMKHGKWCSEVVLELNEKAVNGRIQYSFVKKTSYQGLYNAFITATKAKSSSDKWNRQFRYPGKQYDHDLISAMGWNAFVGQYKAVQALCHESKFSQRKARSLKRWLH